MNIAVASGKGGTGKTLVATSLTWLLEQRGKAVEYIDADVEAPNGHLFLKPSIESRRRVSTPVPTLGGRACSGCGRCQQVCAFNAIVALPDGVMVFDELCHGCGACVMVCPVRSLTERPHELGALEQGTVESSRSRLRMATLDVGEARATPLVDAVVAPSDRREQSSKIEIIDAPPGTSCSAMAAVRTSDLVLLVTEPTPFGVHDLDLALDMVSALGKRALVVINRSDLGSDEVRRVLEGRGVEIVAEIPFLDDVAEAYAQGRIAVRESSLLKAKLEPILDHMRAERRQP